MIGIDSSVLAAEFGYRGCEKGWNLEKTLAELVKVMDTDKFQKGRKVKKRSPRKEKLEKVMRKLLHAGMKDLLGQKPWMRIVDYDVFESPQYQKVEELFEDSDELNDAIATILDKVEKDILNAIRRGI